MQHVSWPDVMRANAAYASEQRTLRVFSQNTGPTARMSVPQHVDTSLQLAVIGSASGRKDPNPLLSILYHTILYYTILLLYCTALHCTTLHYTTLHYTILYYTLLYSTLLYSTLLYSTLLYSTLLYSTPLYSTLLYSTLLQYTILYYTRLYYTILCYTILYYTILYSWPSTTQRAATNLNHLARKLGRTPSAPTKGILKWKSAMALGFANWKYENWPSYHKDSFWERQAQTVILFRATHFAGSPARAGASCSGQKGCGNYTLVSARPPCGKSPMKDKIACKDAADVDFHIEPPL